MKPAFRIDHALTLVVLTGLMVGCFLVLQPFLTAIAWAAILCATMWPFFLRVTRWLGGRRNLAALVMVVLIAVIMLAPFVIVGLTLAGNAELLGAAIRRGLADGPPDPPSWVAGLPLVGEIVASTWATFAHDTARLLEEAHRYIEPARELLLDVGTTVLGGLFQLALSVVIAFFFFRDGVAIIERAHGALEHLAGERGHRLADVATLTVRGVVVGILGTALAQGVLMAIGLALVGIKAAPLLGLATFFLSPVPIGPPLVWAPVGLWLIYQGAVGSGIFLLLWGFLIVSTVDNVLKPLIISRGSDLPFVLVLLGILGGAVAFGFIGVFLGPVLIAIGFVLLKEWTVSAPPAVSEPTDAAPD